MPEEKGVLWENGEMSLQSAFKPAIPRTEGFHLVLLQKKEVPSPWGSPELYARMSRVAAIASGVLIEVGMADWANIQYNGNLDAGKKPKMHIHIFARLKTGLSWGGPIQLPRGEGPYGNDPLTDEEVVRLRSALIGRL